MKNNLLNKNKFLFVILCIINSNMINAFDQNDNSDKSDKRMPDNIKILNKKFDKLSINNDYNFITQNDIDELKKFDKLSMNDNVIIKEKFSKLLDKFNINDISSDNYDIVNNNMEKIYNIYRIFHDIDLSKYIKKDSIKYIKEFEYIIDKYFYTMSLDMNKVIGTRIYNFFLKFLSNNFDIQDYINNNKNENNFKSIIKLCFNDKNIQCDEQQYQKYSQEYSNIITETLKKISPSSELSLEDLLCLVNSIDDKMIYFIKLDQMEIISDYTNIYNIYCKDCSHMDYYYDIVKSFYYNNKIIIDLLTVDRNNTNIYTDFRIKHLSWLYNVFVGNVFTGIYNHQTDIEIIKYICVFAEFIKQYKNFVDDQIKDSDLSNSCQLLFIVLEDIYSQINVGISEDNVSEDIIKILQNYDLNNILPQYSDSEKIILYNIKIINYINSNDFENYINNYINANECNGIACMPFYQNVIEYNKEENCISDDECLDNDFNDINYLDLMLNNDLSIMLIGNQDSLRFFLYSTITIKEIVYIGNNFNGLRQLFCLSKNLELEKSIENFQRNNFEEIYKLYYYNKLDLIRCITEEINNSDTTNDCDYLYDDIYNNETFIANRLIMTNNINKYFEKINNICKLFIEYKDRLKNFLSLQYTNKDIVKEIDNYLSKNDIDKDRYITEYFPELKENKKFKHSIEELIVKQIDTLTNANSEYKISNYY